MQSKLWLSPNCFESSKKLGQLRVNQGARDGKCMKNNNVIPTNLGRGTYPGLVAYLYAFHIQLGDFPSRVEKKKKNH